MDFYKEYLLNTLSRSANSTRLVEDIATIRTGLYVADVVRGPLPNDYWICHTGSWETEPILNSSGSPLNIGDKVLLAFAVNSENRGFIIIKISN